MIIYMYITVPSLYHLSMKTAMQSSFDDKTLIHECFHSDLLDFSFPFQNLPKISNM